MDTKTTTTTENKQDTITFQPTSRNRQMLDAAMGIRRAKNGKIVGAWRPQRGVQSTIVNKALEKFLPIILQEQKVKAAENQS